MYDRYLSSFNIPPKEKKLKRKSQGDTSDYIISYVSYHPTYTDIPHAILCVSRKIQNDYYMVNSIGIKTNEYGTYVGHDLIHPEKKQFEVYSEHYEVDNNTAKQILSSMQKMKNKYVDYSAFKKNCHNLVLFILENHGIHDNKLYKYTFPRMLEKSIQTVTRVDVPSVIKEEKENYLFYKKGNGKTLDPQQATPEELSSSKTWQWNNMENKKIKKVTSYLPYNTNYYAIIKKTPDLKEGDSPEKIKLKQAIYLLKNYAEGNFLFQLFRHHRDLVKIVITKIETTENPTVEKLLTLLREVIQDNQLKNGIVPNTKGSLFKRMRFIDRVLNKNNIEEEKSQKPSI